MRGTALRFVLPGLVEKIVSEKGPHIAVRDAEEAEVSALTAIKGEGSAAVHRDRLRDAQDANIRYLVLLADREIVGFASLVFHRPSYWSAADGTERLPQSIDVQAQESQRRKGYGSALIEPMEGIAAGSGYRQLYISVEPVDNPLAPALYLRLGFQPLQSEP